MNVIQTEGLTKFYGRSRGILDLDLEVREGEFFGFIGPNGAGKSTTIRILMGLIRKTQGSVWMLGMDILKEKEKILSKTGYLPAEAVFYPDMRGRDLIRFSADLHRKDCRKTSDELCERLQFDPSRRISELSFGNRKKLAVICALQHNPRLCILDEPTGGLDPLMQREFFEILKERNKKGMTVFLSSHILSEVQCFLQQSRDYTGGQDHCLRKRGRTDTYNRKTRFLYGELLNLPACQMCGICRDRKIRLAFCTAAISISFCPISADIRSETLPYLNRA